MDAAARPPTKPPTKTSRPHGAWGGVLWRGYKHDAPTGTGPDMCITDTIKDQPKKFYRVVETP